MPFPPPGDLSDPGIELRSAAMQVDALPTELSGKPFFHPYEGQIILRRNSLFVQFFNHGEEVSSLCVENRAVKTSRHLIHYEILRKDLLKDLSFF